LNLGTGTDNINATQLTITDNSTNPSSSTFNITDNALTTLNLAGTHSIYIGTLNDTGATTATSLTIQDNSTNTAKADTIGTLDLGSYITSLTFSGSHNLTIDTFTDTAATGALAITNSGTGSVILGTTQTTNQTTGVTTPDSTFNGTSLTLSDNVGLGTYTYSNISGTSTWTGGLSAQTTGNAGFTLAGANDNANVNFSLSDTVSSATSSSTNLQSNTIVLGNGNDKITLNSDLADLTYSGSGAALTNNITVGTGTNSINLNDTNSTSATVSDIIKFADNSAVFTGGTTPTHLTTVTATVPADVSFDLSLVLGSNALHFDSTAISETAATLSAALSAAVATVHGVNDNAGYFTYGTSTYFFADSQTNPGHEAIIGLVGTVTQTTVSGDIVHIAAVAA
jgi:hypothetical protein